MPTAFRVPIYARMPIGAAVSAARPRRGVILRPQCALAASLFCLALHAADDPKEILRRALQINAHDSEIARNYTFLQRRESRSLDGKGAVKSRESITWDVTLLEGSPYRRIVQRNDKPLTPKEEERQEADLRKSADQRRKETPEKRRKRLDAEQENRRKMQEELDQIPDAFDLHLLGEEQFEGLPVWIIDAVPRRDYKPKSRALTFITKLKGRIWVSQNDYRPVKFDAETIDTISIAGFVARVHKGLRIHVEFTRVNGEVWMPRFSSITGSGRLFLVKGLRIDQDTTFSNYRKFTAESRVVE